MNQDLRAFIFSMVRIVLPAVFLVAMMAFVSIPYTLGHHPGDPVAAESGAPRHMT
ncbi:hypothetical protein [Polaromonas sp.]|uniref:hypothetical protein n=1 Tax=Polaromonas sp. TaxID=1869339 RepID=UPI00248A36DF|nr:hypothetical protein [Polaromonas sp.]MDI1272888.1 hypothetical protein [Polaromonas sp.]